MTQTNLMEALKLEDREEQPRYAAQRMLAARTGDLQQRRLLTRARNSGESHRRSDSHEGLALLEEAVAACD